MPTWLCKSKPFAAMRKLNPAGRKGISHPVDCAQSKGNLFFVALQFGQDAKVFEGRRIPRCLFTGGDVPK